MNNAEYLNFLRLQLSIEGDTDGGPVGRLIRFARHAAELCRRQLLTVESADRINDSQLLLTFKCQVEVKEVFQMKSHDQIVRLYAHRLTEDDLTYLLDGLVRDGQ